MIKRPISISIIGWLLAGAGAVGLVYHATDLKVQGPLQYELVWVCLVRVLAIVGGLFTLRGRNWARWLLVLWMAYHVILSGFHAVTELVVHGLLFVVITYFLMRPKVSPFFRRGT